MKQKIAVFNLARFRFDLQVTTPIQLPAFTGAALRGAFGTVFRRIVCVQGLADCRSCLLRLGCSYSLIFSTPNLPNNAAFIKNNDLTRPFVLEIGNDTQQLYFPKHEVLPVQLTLIGRSIDYFPYFLITLRELGLIGFGVKNEEGQRGKYRIKQVYQLREGEERVIFTSEGEYLSPVTPENIPVCIPEPTEGKPRLERIKISYLTPCRVKYHGAYCGEIQFHVLIRNALRRISQLYFFDTNQQLDLDYKGLIERAQTVVAVKQDLRWCDWERYSTRQQGRLKMGGVVGEAYYHGALGEYRWLLKLGEYFHVGKGVTFGFGKIRTIFI